MTVLLPTPRLRTTGDRVRIDGANGRSGPGASAGRRYGRVATDLRVSLTDRCNLRCTYCMPAEGLDWLAREDLLSDEETLRLIDIGVRLLGIRTVRLTGGEPLLRRGLEDLVARIAELRPAAGDRADHERDRAGRSGDALAAAGLDRINISLDTLDPDTFKRLTRRRPAGRRARRGGAARAAGLDPVKINAVLMRGVNDHEAADLLRWAIREGVQLRFIEQMPLDAQHAWQRTEMVTAEEIRARLGAELELVEDEVMRGPGERSRRAVPGGRHRAQGRHHRVGDAARSAAHATGSG